MPALITKKINLACSKFSLQCFYKIRSLNKVFTKCNAKADGMDTIFGHYAEYSDEGKLKYFLTFDDTLSMFNAMK